MRSVGPFELTETEFAGLTIVLREDERLLSGLAIIRDCMEISLQARPSSATRDGLDFDTGESGETAEAEAESARLEEGSGSVQIRSNIVLLG